jgi:S1-C subfamily serine protease
MRKFKKILAAKGITVVFTLALLLVGAATLMMAGEKVQKGYLGVGIENLTEDDKEEYGTDFGLLVTSVLEGEAAEKAGIKKHDVIRYFNKKKMLSTDDLIDAVRDTKPGTKAKVKIMRDGKPKELTVTVGELKSQFSWFDSDRGKNFLFRSGKGRGYLGVHMHELNKDLAEYFGVNADEGVLILKVEEDSPAEKAGLKSGDIISEIDGKKVRDAGKVGKVVSAYEKGDKIELKIVRHKKEKSVKVELGETTGLRSIEFLKGPGYLKGLKQFYTPRLKFIPGNEDDFRIFLRDGKHRKEIREGIKKKIEEAKKKAEKKKKKGIDI